MDATSSTVGRCPHCEVPIPGFRVLIEYESEGRTRRYAECPGCEDVVAPQ